MGKFAKGLASGMVGAVAGAMVIVTAPTVAAQDPNPLLPLVELAAQGLQEADEMAVARWVEGLGVKDEAGYQQMLQEVVQYAKDQGYGDVDPAYVERIISDQLNASEGVQYMNFANWEIDPAAAPTKGRPFPAVRNTMRETSNELAKGVLDSAAARSTQRAQCVGNLESARVSARAVRKLRPALNPYLNYATRSFC